jgi:ferrous iron transport protein A
LQLLKNVILMQLSKLAIGQSAVIQSFTDEEMSLKLLEMGCLPGEIVRIERIAPLGDPIAVSVSGYLLSMRKEEAATIIVEVSK